VDTGPNPLHKPRIIKVQMRMCMARFRHVPCKHHDCVLNILKHLHGHATVLMIVSWNGKCGCKSKERRRDLSGETVRQQ